jgi:hypothetical protein
MALGASGGIGVATTPFANEYVVFDPTGTVTAQSTFPGHAALALDVTAIDPTPGAEDTYAIASGSSGDVSVVSVRGAVSSASVALSSFPVLRDLLTGFDGKHLSITSSGSMLGVAWLTSRFLSPGAPTGGWALLACR